MELLDSYYQIIQRKIKDSLSTASSKVNLCVDPWSPKSLRTSYLGVNAHFTNKEFEWTHIFLGMPELLGSHTAKNIRATTFKLLEKYDVSEEKLGITQTDNGANVVCAFKV